jgi:hypothetical protein
MIRGFHFHLFRNRQVADWLGALNLMCQNGTAWSTVGKDKDKKLVLTQQAGASVTDLRLLCDLPDTLLDPAAAQQTIIDVEDYLWNEELDAFARAA